MDGLVRARQEGEGLLGSCVFSRKTRSPPYLLGSVTLRRVLWCLSEFYDFVGKRREERRGRRGRKEGRREGDTGLKKNRL